MTTRPGLRALAATLVAAATALTLAAPAHAETTVRHDGGDAQDSLTDIRTVRVDHGAKRLRVGVGFPDLRKQAEAGLRIYVDTDDARKGPEYVLGTPLFSGGDYQMMRMKDWQAVGEPKTCDFDLDLDWRDDRVRFKAARGCFRKPDQLRVGMKMRDTAPEPAVTDWLIGRRKWTGWLAAGDAA